MQEQTNPSEEKRNWVTKDRWKFYRDQDQIKFNLHDAYLQEDKEKMRWIVVFELETLSGENKGYWTKKLIYDPITNDKTQWYARNLFKELGLPEEKAEYENQTELLTALKNLVGLHIMATCKKRDWNGRPMTNWDNFRLA
tara:strand:+ start:124 stop:543 length:420 start_codon:yes stop_codon:yes gene_type:complete